MLLTLKKGNVAKIKNQNIDDNVKHDFTESKRTLQKKVASLSTQQFPLLLTLPKQNYM